MFLQKMKRLILFLLLILFFIPRTSSCLQFSKDTDALFHRLNFRFAFSLSAQLHSCIPMIYCMLALSHFLNQIIYGVNKIMMVPTTFCKASLNPPHFDSQMKNFIVGVSSACSVVFNILGSQKLRICLRQDNSRS